MRRRSALQVIATIIGSFNPLWSRQKDIFQIGPDSSQFTFSTKQKLQFYLDLEQIEAINIDFGESHMQLTAQELWDALHKPERD